MRSSITTGLVLTVAALCCFTTSTSATQRGDGVCRIIAFSGGGDRAAYEAGVVSAFVSLLSQSDLRYNVVTGVSAGSLAAAIMQTYDYGDEQNMSQYMTELVTSLTKQSIFKDWPGGVLEGLLSRRGLFDTTPLSTLIYERILHRPFVSTRRLIIGATSAETGEMVYWRDTNSNRSVIHDAIMASASIPGVFPAITAKRPDGVVDVFMDGGVKQPIIFEEGIEECLSQGYKESDISIDTILCDPLFIEQQKAGNWTSLNYMMRSLNIGRYYRLQWIINEIKNKYSKIKWRYTVSPSEVFKGAGADFDPM